MREGALIAGKYRLRRRIGEGAVGEVWAALNERTEREVALKVIIGADRELRERAVREARACGRVSHRNVVEILDAGETEHGDPFLAMQLLSGETLSDRMKRERRIHPPKAAAIALDIARGLGAAHAAGIVHRDLKPSNVFLHREPETGLDLIKVLDFGVSKMLWSGGPPTTRTGDIVGSPAYMSPEQARADSTLDHRTDLWSLGVVLFEMLTGERPFPSRNISVISEIVSAPIPHLSSLLPDIDPRLSVIVARCIERDRSRRVQTAEDLAALLRPIAGPEDTRGSSDAWQRLQPQDHAEEDNIPTVAVGSSVVPAAVAAAIAARQAAQAAPPSEPTPSSSRFRPVATTLIDRSKPPPGNPAAMPGIARVESPSAGYAHAQPMPSTPSSSRDPSSPALAALGSVPQMQPGPPRGPMATEDELEDELSTAQMPPGRGRPPAHQQSFVPAFGSPGGGQVQTAPMPSGAHLRTAPLPAGSPAQTGAGPAVHLPEAAGPFGLKRGDATLFLVGVMIVVTLVVLVAIAFGIKQLMSNEDAPPAPPSTRSASAGAEPGR